MHTRSPLKLAQLKLARETAATLLEYILVILLVLGLVGALLEISRYMAISGVLNQSAQRAVNLAARVSDFQFEKGVDSDEEYKRFLGSRDTAVQQGLALALGNFLEPSSESALTAKLIPFEEIETLNQSGEVVSGNVDLLVLRPSEFAYTGDGHGGLVYSHPTLCPEDLLDPCIGPVARRQPGTSMASLLEEQNHPLMAVVRAEVPSLFGFGTYRIEGRALAYRAEPRRGIYAKVPTDSPATPPPAPSPGPSITPDPAFSPTPSRTPTPSPTPTFVCHCSAGQYRFCRRTSQCPYCPNFANECVCTADLSQCGGGGG